MGEKRKANVERQMMTVGVFTFVLISAGLWMLNAGLFRSVANVGKYAPYMAYIAISVAVIGVGVWHIKSYRHTFSCTLGMMAGMTIGMMVGFLLGAIIGATNGLFVGSVYGMFTGMFSGAWCARNCGIMSVMEGLMAGLMGGLMGAMTTVMMLNDNIALFMPILIGSILVIMGGLSVMIFKESEEHRGTIEPKDKAEIFLYVSALFVLAIVTAFLMVYGPKSALVAAF